MKTEYHPVAGIDKEELEKIKWPLDPYSIPYLFKIDLHRVIGMGWVTAKDGQLINLTIDFEPR